MKVLFVLLIALIMCVTLVAYGSRHLHRDGILYNAIATIVTPFTQDYKEPVGCIASSLESDLTRPLEGWRWFNADYAKAQFKESGLFVRVVKDSLWFENSNAFGYFCAAQGDFSIEVSVKTRKSSDAASYPDRDFQFGGIIVRDPRSNAFYGKEDYVFNVVGHRGRFGLQVETKTTVKGASSVKGTDWHSGDADLKIERRKNEHTLWARPNETHKWELIDSHIREDFPDIVEVGLIVYATNWGASPVDIDVEFANLKLKYL